MRIHLALVAGALALASGCAASPRLPVSSYRGASLEEVGLRRVLVLPFQVPGMHPREERMVEETFFTELKKCSWFDVVATPRDVDLVRIAEDSWRHSTIPSRSLIDLSRRFQIDAVCLVNLSAYDPYAPQLMSLKAHLISAGTGDVLWAADGVFDLRDEAARRRLQGYFEGVSSDDGSLYSWELCAVSPARFAQFACHCLLTTLERRG